MMTSILNRMLKNQLSQRLIVLSFIYISLLWAVSSANAATTITENTGTVEVIIDGEKTVYEPGDTIPPIPDGATVNLLDGEAKIHVEAGSWIVLFIGNNRALLDHEEGVVLFVKDRYVLCLHGTATFTNEDKTQTQNLKPGQDLVLFPEKTLDDPELDNPEEINPTQPSGPVSVMGETFETDEPEDDISPSQ